MTQQTRNLGHGAAILFQKRAHHASFVERAGRPRWRVGCEHELLLLAYLPSRFDHHWHELESLLAPALQSLESVEHLEAVLAVGSRSHPQRQRRDQLQLRLRRCRPQRRIAGM
jgi:hypothetical protein